jgi:hypothetical protein
MPLAVSLARTALTAAVACVCTTSVMEAAEIGLHNALKTPVSVLLVSASNGSVTELRIGRNQTLLFTFNSPEFDVQVLPLDRAGTSFRLGRIPFEQVALRLRGTPLVLHGQFQQEACHDGIVREVRVAVHMDLGIDRLTALAPGYELVQPVVYLVPTLMR